MTSNNGAPSTEPLIKSPSTFTSINITAPTTTSDKTVRKRDIAAAKGTFALNEAWSEMNTESVQCSGRPRIEEIK